MLKSACILTLYNHPPQLHVCPVTLRAVWTVYQILSGWRGLTQKEPSATLCMPKVPKVSTPAAAPRPLPVKCQVWNVGHFTPSMWWLSTITATATTPPLISKQVFSKNRIQEENSSFYLYSIVWVWKKFWCKYMITCGPSSRSLCFELCKYSNTVQQWHHPGSVGAHSGHASLPGDCWRPKSNHNFL